MLARIMKLLAVVALAATVLRAASTSADELKSKAAQGDLNAQWQLAEAYTRGSLGLPQDSAAALQWYRKAAEQGSVPAACQIGMHLAQGWGVPPNLSEAYAWLEVCRTAIPEPLTSPDQHRLEMNITSTLNYVAPRLNHTERTRGDARAREIWIELYRARNHLEPEAAQIPEFRGYWPIYGDRAFAK